MPESLGEMCFHTPMLPCRMAWPAANSRKNKGMPTTSISKMYSRRKAPGKRMARSRRNSNTMWAKGKQMLVPAQYQLHLDLNLKGHFRVPTVWSLGACRMSVHVSNVTALTSPILVTQIRKPPDIPESDAESHLSQKILYFAVPSGPSVWLGRVLRAALAREPVVLSGFLVVVISGQRLLLHLKLKATKWKNKYRSTSCFNRAVMTALLVLMCVTQTYDLL